MSPEVSKWLNDVCSIELTGMFQYADSVLLKLGYLNAESVGLMAFNDGFSTTQEFIDRLRTIYNEGLRDVIRLHGIGTESTDLPALSHIVYGLRIMSDTEDTLAINRMLDSYPEDKLMAVASLLAYFAGGDWTHYYSHLDYVGDEFINRLTERSEEATMESYEQPLVGPQLKAFHEKYPNTLMSLAVREEGASPGLSLSVSMTNFKDQLQSLCPNNPRQYAIEAYGFAALAGIPDANKRESILALALEYTKQPGFIAMVGSYLNGLITEFKHYA